MASDLCKQRLREILEQLKADNPSREDWFRLSKSGDSIGEFDPGCSVGSGVMLYGEYLGNDMPVCMLWEKDGVRRGIRVQPDERAMYEGFPDPPKTDCRFLVGQAVRVRNGNGQDGVVLEIETRQGADRHWQYRVKVSDGNQGYRVADQSMFEAADSVTAAQEGDRSWTG